LFVYGFVKSNRWFLSHRNGTVASTEAIVSLIYGKKKEREKDFFMERKDSINKQKRNH